MNLVCNKDCCKVNLSRTFKNELSGHKLGILSLIAASAHTKLQWAHCKCQVNRESSTVQVKVSPGKVLTSYLGLDG